MDGGVQRTQETDAAPAVNQNVKVNNSKPKSLAVLVKVTPNSTYADTVRALRGSKAINPADFGAQITAMRKTRDGHLLVELAKGARAEAVAVKFGAAIHKELGDSVGGVA